MIPVTDGFNTAIYGSSRKTAGKVIFQIVDVTALFDATPTVTGEASISQKTQLFNQNINMTGKYAALENDYWALDGTFTLPPKNTETQYEVGWWSAALCGADKSFVVSQVVTVDFTIDHSSIGITIVFDILTNEYAEDFTIVVKNSGGSTIHTETVVGNAETKYVLEQNLSNYRQIVITITKWANGYRRARITEIGFGIIEEYTGSELVNINVLEEIDTLNDLVSSNEMKFTIDNQDKRFNILNPTGIYPYLQRKQKILPYIGVERADTVVEYIPMGAYYLTEWKSDEGTLTATFTARDILDILSQNNFPETAYSSKTLTFIAEAVLSAAGITDYQIDTALSSITVSGTLPESSYRETLQTLAIAGQVVVYSDRYGVLQIQQLSTTPLSHTIGFDNVYATPLIKLDRLINTVNVIYGASVYTLVDPTKPTSEQTLSVKIENPLIGTLAHAQNVANWVLSEYQKRFLYEINWRGNSALEVSDIVTVEDDFSEDKTTRITKQDITFNGALSVKTYGKGDGT